MRSHSTGSVARSFSANLGLGLLLLAVAPPFAQGASPALTWKECHDRAGEPFSGKRPHTCPDGQHQIGHITDARCSCICCSPAGAATESRILYGLPIREKRDGRESVWGIRLELSSALKNPVNPQQVSIVEAKHSRELRDLMDFRLKERGKELIIIFKPGNGDFGSGNSVHIEIKPGTLLSNWKDSTKGSSTDVKTDVP